MITIENLVNDIKYKHITYNNEEYYVIFSKIYIGHDYKYIITLRRKIVSQLLLTMEDILTNSELKYHRDLKQILLEVNKDENVRHSPTYIQKIVETFFNKYLDELKTEEKRKTEIQMQIDNFKNWGGVIK